MTDDKRVAEIRRYLEDGFYSDESIIQDLLTALDATTARLREAEGLVERLRKICGPFDTRLRADCEAFLKGANNG